MHADLRVIARVAFDLVLAKPVIDAVVQEEAAAVGIDMHAVVIGPEFARFEGNMFLGPVGRSKKES